MCVLVIDYFTLVCKYSPFTFTIWCEQQLLTLISSTEVMFDGFFQVGAHHKQIN